jgi:trigger factor
MQVTVQKLSPVLMEFDVVVDADRVQQELEKSYSSIGRSSHVRGFRPGKAPRQVIAQLFGARIASDVAKRLVDETFQQALTERQIQPISSPAVESQSVTPDQPFEYKARFEVLPDIAEVKYDHLHAKRAKIEISDAQIDEQLERVRREHSTFEAKPEGGLVASGDIVTIDFTVWVSDRMIKDAGAQDFTVEIGAGSLIPGIEAGILGHKVGEQVSIEVDLPADHRHPKLKGKRATFKMTIKNLKVRVLPSLDNEFAKDVGDFDTLDALRQDVQQKLEKVEKERTENAVAEQLVAELVKANPIEVPSSLVEQQAQITQQEILQRARTMGGAPQQLGDQLLAQVRAESEMKVRAGLLMAAIARTSGITIGDKEIEDGLTELAEQTGKNIAKLRAEYRDKQKRDMLIGMILENKVLDLIEAKAHIEEA